MRYFPAGYAGGVTTATLDLSDASDTTQFTWVPKNDCVIHGFGGVVTEAMGTMTTTVGVGSLTISGTEKSTVTATPSAAIGTETYGTQFKPVKVAAGATILFKTKTQAVGGTITGEYAPFIYVEFFPAITPA